MDVVTDLSLESLVKGSTDINAVIHLAENLPHASITYVPHLHAKVYLANRELAVISSANFTSGGARRNLEYGIRLQDAALVHKIQADIERYARLGGKISLPVLLDLREKTVQLRQSLFEEERTISQKLRAATQELEETVRERLIEIHVEGRSFHAILCDTLKYLLTERPMTTEELHERVRDIHPDLCDDRVDRIIRGRHFGKKWKHELRNAQQTLKRKGIIEQHDGGSAWSLKAEYRNEP
jgi:hypothetical protein